jgi:hypothetical protein
MGARGLRVWGEFYTIWAEEGTHRPQGREARLPHDQKPQPKTTAAPVLAPADKTRTTAARANVPATGYGAQAAALRPTTAAGSGATAVKPAAPTSGWATVARARFSTWDRNGDGFISRAEANSLMLDPRITGAEAAAVAALHKAIEDLEELSNDELGDENDGLSRTDLAAYEAGKQRGVDLSYTNGRSRIAGQSRVLFPNGAPTLSALRQGGLGDCYFLAALGSVIARDPMAVVRMIRENRKGKQVVGYTVDFPGRGTVTIAPPTDAEVARYSSSGGDGLWLPVLEKAYGQVKGKSARTDRQAEVGEGDQLSEGVLTFSGHRGDHDFLALTGLAATRGKLTRAFKEGRIVTAAIMTENRLKLPKGHAYSVIGWDARADRITIRNPWGSNPKGAPGEATGVFTLPLPEFDDIFAELQYA